MPPEPQATMILSGSPPGARTEDGLLQRQGVAHRAKPHRPADGDDVRPPSPGADPLRLALHTVLPRDAVRRVDEDGLRSNEIIEEHIASTDSRIGGGWFPQDEGARHTQGGRGGGGGDG